MKRRVIAALASILIAAVSAVVLMNYVSGADRRAMAGMQTSTVLVATERVPKGTAADQLTKLVQEKTLPKKAVVPGAISRLSDIAGKVATTDLEPGEQLLPGRFSRPQAAVDHHPVKVPSGLEQVSVQLDPQRVVGGDLAAGDLVGVFVSLGNDSASGRTHLTLHKVLLTRIQGAVSPAPAGSDQQSGASTKATTTKSAGDSSQPVVADPVPQGSLIVTLALSAPDAEKLIFAGEYGHVWLSLEDARSSTTDTRIVTEKNELS